MAREAVITLGVYCAWAGNIVVLAALTTVAFTLLENMS